MSDISSRNLSIGLISGLLLVPAVAPETAYGETIGSLGYRNPGMFQYDYPGQRPVEAFQSAQKSNRVAPSFKPEFGSSDDYSPTQRHYLQQHLLRMGFKFRDTPGIPDQLDSLLQFQLQTTGGQSGYGWDSGDASTGPAPKFRPLDSVDLKKIERISGKGITPMPAVAAPYGLTGSYRADLPGHFPVSPVFRPIP